MSNSILGAVREFLQKSDLFEGNAIRINFLGEAPLEYTLEDVPAEPVIKRYLDGSSVRQALFVIASREFYGRDVIENLKACGFYEKLADWLEAQSAIGALPELSDGMKARKIEATTNGYCMAADIEQKIQRYQIQCRLIYEKEGL